MKIYPSGLVLRQNSAVLSHKIDEVRRTILEAGKISHFKVKKNRRNRHNNSVKITDILAKALDTDTQRAEEVYMHHYTYSIMLAAYYIGFEYIEGFLFVGGLGVHNFDRRTFPAYPDQNPCHGCDKIDSCEYLKGYCINKFNVESSYNLARIVSWKTVLRMFEDAHHDNMQAAGINYPIFSTFIWVGCYGFGNSLCEDDDSLVFGGSLAERGQLTNSWKSLNEVFNKTVGIHFALTKHLKHFFTFREVCQNTCSLPVCCLPNLNESIASRILPPTFLDSMSSEGLNPNNVPFNEPKSPSGPSILLGFLGSKNILKAIPGWDD